MQGEAQEALHARNDGGPKELAPVWRGDGQEGHQNGPGPIGAAFGNEPVEYKKSNIIYLQKISNQREEGSLKVNIACMSL